MSKRNERLMKIIDSVSEDKLRRSRVVGRQQTLDIVLMTLNNLGFNKDDIRHFVEVYRTNENKYCHSVIEDSNNDYSIEYSKFDIDRDLKEVLPEDMFVPYDERYTRFCDI